MKLFNSIKWDILFSVFVFSFFLVSLVGVVYSAYLIGYQKGQADLTAEYQSVVDQYLAEKASSKVEYPVTYVLPKETTAPKPTETPVTWTGPELWEILNQRRIAYGVNPLKIKDELCTIASLRLNELMELGKLDGHLGFSNLPERRPDLKPIFDNYVIAEFLLSGAKTASEAVSLWENTLGHKKIISGGEYVWGCAYAQNGFAVGIAAYQ